MKREKLTIKQFQKKHTRKAAVFIAVILLMVNQIPLDARETVAIELNGQTIVYNEEYGFPFIDENDRTQVPFRLTMETFGADVSWDQERFVATAELDDIRIDVPIGEQYILRNGERILNDTTSRIIDSRTYLPIRIVLEAFGAEVKWDNKNFKVVIQYEAEANIFTRIPKYFDLRNTNRLSPIKDQFDTGACWAFASYGAMESQLLPDEVWDFSEDHLSLGHGFNLDQADGGNAAISLSYLTRWSGPVLEVDDPFNDGINNPNAKVMKHVQEVQFIPDNDLLGIKVALLTYGPVQTSIYLDAATLNPQGKFYNEGNSSYYYFGNKGYNHDVVIVGWDDAYPKENFRTESIADGAFIVRNSYGESFGEEGYFYISYDDAHVGTNNIVFTRVDEVDNYDHIYQTDWLGFIGQIGYGDETAYFSNVYETDQRELLDAVSFYATDDRTNYEVYVVDSFEDTADFKDMKLIDRGYVEFGGYYTIDFEVPITVEGRFAVIVRITTPGSQYPVAAEFWRDDIEWLNTVNIADGEGYMSYDGQDWERTEVVLGANTCLKAFTQDYDISLLEEDLPADSGN